MLRDEKKKGKRRNSITCITPYKKRDINTLYVFEFVNKALAGLKSRPSGRGEQGPRKVHGSGAVSPRETSSRQLLDTTDGKKSRRDRDKAPRK